jgi:hypothetical protein
MKRKILFFLCFILCIISLASVSAADEITEITDNNDDLVSVSQDGVGNELLSENQAIVSDLKSEANNDKDNASLNTDNSVRETKFNLQDLTMYYEDGRRFSGNLTDGEGNPLSGMTVFVKVNGVNRSFITDQNGGFSFAVHLIPGSYDVDASFPGATGYSKSNGTAVINVKPTLYSLDLIKMYGNPLKYIVLVSQNLTLEGVNLCFNINGRLYYRTTGLLGTASLAINLIPGSYVVTTERLDTHEKSSKHILVLPLLTENKDVDMYYKNGSTYHVKVIKQDGNTSAGEVVTFNINGVFYSRACDRDGHIEFNINLPPGHYIVTAEYKGYKVSNNITVRPVISANDLTKTYGTPDPFVAKLLNGTGDPDPGKIIKFNINGVFYNATTDGDGVGKLNINLMPGEYIITSVSPNGDTISNRIVVKKTTNTS